MAAIVITITTAYAQIFDTNGRNGWGTVVVRPSQAFEYTGTASDTFTVTDAAKTVTVEDGVITKVDGVAATTLTLSPSDGASNNPVVYYVVDINVNGTTQRKFWVLDYAASTSVAWSSVEQLPSADDPDSAYNQLVNAANPLPQYLLKADTVDAATAGEVSDGRGAIPRCDPSTGKLPASFMPSTYDAFPTGTRLLFQQTTAPTGWTKDTAAAYNSAMVVGTTGSVGSGGTADPTATHTHTGPSHTHTGPSHTHLLDAATFIDYTNVTFGGGNTITGVNASTRTEAGGTGSTGSGGTGATGANTAPKYFSVIVASKD